LQPFAANKRNPFVAGEKGMGAGLPAATTFRLGNVVALELNPLVTVIAHSPGSGSVSAAAYSPRFAPGLAVALATSPLVAVARTVGCNPVSGVCPCWRTVNTRFSGLPATAYSGKSLRVMIAQPPAKTGIAKANKATSEGANRTTTCRFIGFPFYCQ